MGKKIAESSKTNNGVMVSGDIFNLFQLYNFCCCRLTHFLQPLHLGQTLHY